jgi:glyoxylase-like metal-dependent hydrolase (beta-lactamase superfamily II)
MVIDTTATPLMAQDLIRRIRTVTDKPIKYVVLSHYHAVRVLGRLGLRCARGRHRGHRLARHLRPDRRARRRRHEVGDRALPAPVRRRRDRCPA